MSQYRQDVLVRQDVPHAARAGGRDPDRHAARGSDELGARRVRGRPRARDRGARRAAAAWGTLETPVYLTSTRQLGRAYDAACTMALQQSAGVADDVVIPVVAECDDSFLNDCRRMQLEAADVVASWEAAPAASGASAPPPTGSVGAGHTVAVLLLTNFGERSRLTVDGVPVERLLPPSPAAPRPPAGSCIGVVVTDAPVSGADCGRLARRIGLGLAGTGSTGHHGSGEIFLAASTTARTDRDGTPEPGPRVAGRALDPTTLTRLLEEAGHGGH